MSILLHISYPHLRSLAMCYTSCLFEYGEDCSSFFHDDKKETCYLTTEPADCVALKRAPHSWKFYYKETNFCEKTRKDHVISFMQKIYI